MFHSVPLLRKYVPADSMAVVADADLGDMQESENSAACAVNVGRNADVLQDCVVSSGEDSDAPVDSDCNDVHGVQRTFNAVDNLVTRLMVHVTWSKMMMC